LAGPETACGLPAASPEKRLCPAQEKGIIVFAVDREGTPGAERSISLLQIKFFSNGKIIIATKALRHRERLE
jgi:hypothetical protein